MWNNKHDLAWIPQDRCHPRSIVGFANRNLSITTTLHTSFMVNNQTLAPVFGEPYHILPNSTPICSVPNTKLQLGFDAHEKETADMNLFEYFYATTTHT